MSHTCHENPEVCSDCTAVLAEDARTRQQEGRPFWAWSLVPGHTPHVLLTRSQGPDGKEHSHTVVMSRFGLWATNLFCAGFLEAGGSPEEGACRMVLWAQEDLEKMGHVPVHEAP